MTNATTLLQLAGADLTPADTANAVLIMIDLQNEYLEGPVAVPDAMAVIAAARDHLDIARAAGGDIIHVAHAGAAGSLFDRQGNRGQIIDDLAPRDGEQVIEKGLPNAFAGTGLHAVLQGIGKKDIILCGLMTHMCVSSTARAALDLGYRVTVNADACATRPLPDGRGGEIDARTLHEVALVELSDRFAVIARGAYRAG